MADTKDVPRYVEIVKIGTDEVIRRMGPMTERRAERVEDGIMINMNHEEYYTRVVEAKDEK